MLFSRLGFTEYWVLGTGTWGILELNLNWVIGCLQKLDPCLYKGFQYIVLIEVDHCPNMHALSFTCFVGAWNWNLQHLWRDWFYFGSLSIVGLVDYASFTCLKLKFTRLYCYAEIDFFFESLTVVGLVDTLCICLLQIALPLVLG